jgi:hypothetical protein
MIRVLLDMYDIPSFYLPLTNYMCFTQRLLLIGQLYSLVTWNKGVFYVYRNVVALLRNHCRYGNTAMLSVCAAELRHRQHSKHIKCRIKMFLWRIYVADSNKKHLAFNVIECTERQTDGRADGRTDGRTSRQAGGRTDGQTGGRTDGQTDGQTDRRADGRTGRRTDMTKIKGTFLNLAITPKNSFLAPKDHFV